MYAVASWTAALKTSIGRLPPRGPRAARPPWRFPPKPQPLRKQAVTRALRVPIRARGYVDDCGPVGASCAIASENCWPGQRDGIGATFIDERHGVSVPFKDYLENVLTLVTEDAVSLGCEFEVSRARDIAAFGTSAERQLAIFAKCEPE